MADINTALAANRDAVDEMIRAGEQSGAAWIAPRAPGKWSPSQIVEHVARGLIARHRCEITGVKFWVGFLNR